MSLFANWSNLSLMAARLLPLRISLGAAAIRALRCCKGQDLFVDLGQNLRSMTRGQVLSTSLALAAFWRRYLPPECRRLGILLPPGSMPAVLHLAAILAGRVPVHLPIAYLGNPVTRNNLLARNGIQTVISSRTLFPEHSLPSGWTDLREVISRVGFADKLFARLSQKILPSSVIIRHLKLQEVDPTREAVAYADKTTSRLVSLSHLNLLATVQQIDSTLALLPGERILVDNTLTSIPALTFGLWYPCLKRNTVLFRSLSARKIDPVIVLCDQEPEAVLLSRDLRDQLIGSPLQLPASIRIFLDFLTEALSPEQTAHLEASGATCCFGYAPPGFGAIVSMCSLDPDSMVPPGTAGQLLPGLSARLVSPDGNPLEANEGTKGILCVQGCSIPGNPDLVIEGVPHHRLDVRAQFDRHGFLTLCGNAL